MGITYEQIQKANDSIKATEIGNKDYAEVHQRVKAFRMLFPMGIITTEMMSNENGVCIFRATVMTDEGHVLGTGTAFEKIDSNFINKTSYIENCETSAVGRALAMCGIGIDVSIASKEEVENAKNNQKDSKKSADNKKPANTEKKAQDEAVELAKAKARVIGYINRHNFTEEEISQICKFFKVESVQDLSLDNCNRYIASVKAKGGNIDE